MTRGVTAACAIAIGMIACAGSNRDVAVESKDRVVDRDEAKSDEYAYVARRPHGTVALAEARGLSLDDAARAVDRLADAMESCAASLEKSGKLVDGAIRVATQVAPEGAVSGIHLTLAPGNAATANALLCVVAPWKLTTFPLADAGARGLAIEATWGPKRAP